MRTRVNWLALLAVALLSFFIVPFTAVASGFERCGTKEPTAEEISLLESLERPRALESLCACLPPGNGGTIPIYFHVIHSGANGDVPLAAYEDQVEVLSAAYADLGITFTLASLDRTDNATWFGADPDTAAETAMKNALAVTPQLGVNFYTLNTDPNLGWATFPWHYAENDKHHGVVIHFASLPGGSLTPYNEGDTAVHEVGHYLGLYHTFQGGCVPPGDAVDDTPAEDGPNYGCSVGVDTCPEVGLDPVDNFMDYSDDACMDRFTTDQAERWYSKIHEYRPSLGLVDVDPADCLLIDGFELNNMSCWQ